MGAVHYGMLLADKFPAGTTEKGNMRQQRTLNGVVGCEGVTLHTGERVRVTIHPSTDGSGIKFLRTDLDDSPHIEAHARSVTDTFYATTLCSQGISISTVEHLMAALFSLGITNAEIHVDGPELPILDGSAQDWISLIDQVGVSALGTMSTPELVIRKPVAVKSNDMWATLYPYEGFAVDCSIEFDHPAIGRQTWQGEINGEIFRKQLARARTFGLLREASKLYSMGRARGANFENVIVLDDDKVVSAGGLRYEDEFVRHKVLDAIGDISLIGVPIRGLLVTHRSGHKLHQQLLRVLLESSHCWEFSLAPRASNREEERMQKRLRRTLELIS